MTEHTREDLELMIKFYRGENHRLRENLKSRDTFLVNKDLFSEYVETLKETNDESIHR